MLEELIFAISIVLKTVNFSTCDTLTAGFPTIFDPVPAWFPQHCTRSRKTRGVLA